MPTLLIALLTSAWGTTGLAWQWDGPQTWVVQTQLRIPSEFWLQAERNLQVRVAEVRTNAVLDCAPERTLGKRGWEIRCDVRDFGIQAAPESTDHGLLEILDELDGRLTGQAWVEVVMTADGRVRSVDLEGVDKSNRRLQEIHESLRLLLTRSMAGFDLRLPRKGDDKDAGEWEQGAPLAMGLLTSQGTMGSARITHTLTPGEAGVVEIASAGRGVLGSGETIAVNGNERPRDLFDMSLEGTATFDTAHGRLLRREVVVHGQPTASSVSAEGTPGVASSQAIVLTWVAPGTELDPIGPNAVLVP